jgi:hypothetical protein
VAGSHRALFLEPLARIGHRDIHHGATIMDMLWNRPSKDFGRSPKDIQTPLLPNQPCNQIYLNGRAGGFAKSSRSWRYSLIPKSEMGGSANIAGFALRGCSHIRRPFVIAWLWIQMTATSLGTSHLAVVRSERQREFERAIGKRRVIGRMVLIGND